MSMSGALKRFVEPYACRSRLRAEGARLAAAMDDPEARAVGDAFLKAGCRAFDTSEQALLERAGAQRASGNTRTGTIDQPDCGIGSLQQVWASMCFALVRAVNPSCCLELCSRAGIATACMAAALRLNGAGGRVFTLEAAPGAAAETETHFRNLGFENIDAVAGPFHETLGPLVAEHPGFGFVFIDGHHDEQITWDCLSRIEPALADRAVIVLDRIARSAGMRRVWERLAADPRMTHACDLRHAGVCICRGTSG